MLSSLNDMLLAFGSVLFAALTQDFVFCLRAGRLTKFGRHARKVQLYQEGIAKLCVWLGRCDQWVLEQAINRGY
jgi:hypothetical protein